MKKLRSDALWNELTPEQLEKLDAWLFEENQSYSEILSKAQRELGFKGSDGSLRRYYQRRRQERVMEELAETKGSPEDVEALRVAAVKMAGTYAYQQLAETPEEVEKWGPALKLMVENDHNQTLREGQKLRRELREEDRKLRREAMGFAKEKFQFDTMEQALKALTQLRELAEARKDPDLRGYEENVMLNKLRREMFGVVWEAFPESAREEEEMLAALKERKARREREAKSREERERIDMPQPPPPSSPHYQEYLEWKMKKENGGATAELDYEI